MQTQSISPVDGDALQLVFSYNDLTKISALTGVKYIDVSLTGGWSTTAKNADGIETALNVTTLRIDDRAMSAAEFINTSWTDSTTKQDGKSIDVVLTSDGS